jgi:hydrogenase nickel incorporation protein HypA/HybF
MHELALCGSIADIVTRHAAGRRLDAVRIRIGQLRQVVPDTLEFCWELVTAETALANRPLLIDRVAARLRVAAEAAL